MTILPEEVKLPPEMQAILDRPNIPEGYERYTSYEDTIIVNPLFLPIDIQWERVGFYYKLRTKKITKISLLIA